MNVFDGSYTVGVPGEPAQVCGLFYEQYGTPVPKHVATLVIDSPSGNTEIRVGGRYVSAVAGSTRGLSIVAGTTETLMDVQLDELWIDGATAANRVVLTAFVKTRRAI